MDEIFERKGMPNVSYHKHQQQQNYYHQSGVSFDDLRILRNEVHSIVNNRFDEVKNHVHAIENRINHTMRNRKTVVEKKNESFEDEIIKIVKMSLETKSNTYKRIGFTEMFNFLKHIFDFKETKEDLRNIIHNGNNNLMIEKKINKEYIVMTKK